MEPRCEVVDEKGNHSDDGEDDADDIFYDDYKTCLTSCSKKVVPSQLAGQIASYLPQGEMIRLYAASRATYSSIPSLTRKLEDLKQFDRLIKSFNGVRESDVYEICKMIQANKGVDHSQKILARLAKEIRITEITIQLFKCILNNPRWKMNNKTKEVFINNIPWNTKMGKDFIKDPRLVEFFKNLDSQTRAKWIDGMYYSNNIPSNLYDLLFDIPDQKEYNETIDYLLNVRKPRYFQEYLLFGYRLNQSRDELEKAIRYFNFLWPYLPREIQETDPIFEIITSPAVGEETKQILTELKDRFLYFK